MDAGIERSLRYLYGLQSHGIKPGLSRTLALLEAVGNPQRRVQAVHVGGTNGKGSTAAMLASILDRQGYRVGLYTSPHLVEFPERIRLNGRSISARSVGKLTDRLREAAATMWPEEPTFFEVTTAMAFLYFAEASVDCAVMEVGLGGRFDATNVLIPLVSVITTIGLDHQEHLGDTLEAIAFEKAGIVKTGAGVVAGRIDPGQLSVIRDAANARRSPCHVFGLDFAVDGDAQAAGGFSYRGLRSRYDGLICSLPGRHQWDNAACALAALEVVSEKGWRVGEEAIREGLRTVAWPGRLECVGHRPSTWLDGAHNPQAADALARSLHDVIQDVSIGDRRVILVLGMMRDKDRRGVIARLAAIPGVRQLILTCAAHPRAADPHDLARDAAGLDVPVAVRPSVADAFAEARALADPEDVICVTGSLLVVGEVKALLEGTTVSDLRG